MLTQKEIKKILSYDEETGIFRWKISIHTRAIKGSIAGGALVIKNSDLKYVIIGFRGKQYLGHRLAFIHHHGYNPESDIDHIDGNGMNNSIKNLREVSRTCNLRNSKMHKHNTSGVRGVSYIKARRKYQPSMQVSGKSIAFGFFDDFTEAVCHRLAAEQFEGWEGCDSSTTAFTHVNKYLNGSL